MLARAILVSLAVAAAASGCAYWDVKQREMIFRPVREVADTPADRGIAYEEIWLTVPRVSGDGDERVHGWWMPAADPRAPALLYLHGTRWSLGHHVQRLAQWRALGFSVLAIDYRGFGRSDGDLPSEDQVYADAQAAWEHLRLREPDAGRRFIYGHSLGGAVAIDLAARNSDAAGLIVESTFTSMRDMAERAGYDRTTASLVLTQRFDSLAKIGRVAVPLMLIHGTGDRYVPVEMGERLYQAAPDPKLMLLVEGAGHRDAFAVAFSRNPHAVRDFIRLARATGSG
jgi:pimeloyl-ACP methyl ester carboxylesterase